MSSTIIDIIAPNHTTTQTIVDEEMSVQTLTILIAALGSAIVLLSILLAIIFCRRNSQKTKLGSRSTEWIGPQANMSFEEDPDNDPVYRGIPQLEDRVDSAPSYLNVNEVSPAAQITINDQFSRDSYAEVDIRCPIPRPQSHMSENSDYENAEGIVYENCNDTPKSPFAKKEPPLPPRKSSTDKDKNENVYRKGTKAHNLYDNSLHDYELSSKHLETHKPIGKGHFSTVYSGMAKQLPYTPERNKKVAIKTIKNSASDSDKQEFLYEFEIMKLTNTLKHENITKLLACVTRTQPYMMVLELMPNGNLRNFLRETRSQDVYYNLHGNSNSLSERQLIQFALDIANGMEGIADLQLLHRDLAARNILLDSNMRCKISDFGFAKDIMNKPEYKSKSVLRRARPVRWLAPESLLYFKHSILSDVWSYGIVLWEIVTLGNLPYPDMKAKEVQLALNQMYRMPCPTHCSSDLYRVMACCWEQNPKNRPPFHQLVDKMRKLLDDATRLIDMDRIEDDDYIDVLPADEQVLFMDYSTDNSSS